MTEEQQQSKQFEISPIGFGESFNYSVEYANVIHTINSLRVMKGLDEAIDYFNDTGILPFCSLFDETYDLNCEEIKNNDEFDRVTKYMLHRAEFARLMTRTGVTPKPDIRIRYKGLWDVPKDLKALSFDGSKRSDE